MKSLLTLLIFCICNVGQAQTPVVHYPFNNNANDAIGNLHGTVTNATLVPDRFGNANSAYSFNGNSSLIVMPHGPAFDFGTGAFSVSCWVKSSSNLGLMTLANKGTEQNSPWKGILLFLNQNSVGQIQGRTDANKTVTSPNGFAYNNNAWHFVVYTRSGTLHSLYIDGTLSNSATHSVVDDVSNNRQLYIGRNPWGPEQYFMGTLDDIKFFNTALTPAQISSLYNAPACGSIPAPTISASGPTNFNMGGSVTLTSSAASGNLWSNGATTQSITVNNSGNYSVRYTNAENCTSEMSTPVTVTVNLPASNTPAIYGSQFNSAIFLNSSLDYVNCGNANINLGAAFTVEAWVNIGAYPTANTLYSIISKISYAATAFTDFPFSLNIGSSGNAYAVFSKGDDYLPDLTVVDPTPLSLNTWYHIAVSFQGSTAVLYKNGSVVGFSTAATPFTLSTGSRPVTIGRAAAEVSNPAGSTSFKGFIDDVRIWNNVRTQSNIIANMNSELAGNEIGLLGYWDMNRSGQGTGLTVTNKALQAGFYPNGQTSGTSTTPVFINCLGLSPVVSASGPVSFCEGGSVTLTSNASSGNLWNTGETTQSITVQATGSYYLTRSVNSICGTLQSNTISTTVNPIPAAPVITPQGSTNICVGSSVVLQSDLQDGILWSNNISGPSITVTTAGTYTATVTSNQGCTSIPSNAITVSVIANTYYQDADGDGFGNPDQSVVNCTLPSGYVTNNQDCNDNNNQVHPGATEYLNGLDDNCDGQVDNNAICKGAGLIFQKSLGGSADDDIAAVAATDDGGFVIGGTTSSRNGSFTSTGSNTRPDGWLTKMNKDGLLEWQKILTGANKISDIKKCSDGGYILAGQTPKRGFFYLNSDIYLAKINAAGTIQWVREVDAFNNQYDDESIRIIQSQDNGFLLIGKSETGSLLFKFSSFGDLVWQRSGFTNNTDITATPDNGFLLTFTANIFGCRANATNGSIEIIVAKLSSTGELQWQKCYGGNGTERSARIIQTNDNHFLVAGSSTNVSGDVTSNAGQEDVWLIKIDGFGNLVWQKSYGGSQKDVPVSITASADNGFVIAAISSSGDGLLTQNQGGADFWAFKINSTGDLEWQRSLGGSGTDYTQSIALLQDGNFIMAGTTNSTNGDITQAFGNKDAWIVKLMDITPQTFYADTDGDGYGNAQSTLLACEKPAGYVSNSLDCDDSKNFVYPGAAEICGNGIDDNCNGQIDEFNPTPALTSITGPTNVCPFVNNGLTASFTVNAVTNATSYVWQVPPFVNIVSGQGTNSVALSFDAGFLTSANKNIRVYAVSPCDVSNTVQLSLTAQAPGTPQTITASSTNICASIQNNTVVTYTIPKVAGASSYIWTSQAGTTTVSHPAGAGMNDTIIQVQFSPAFSTSAITVQAINDCGSGGLRSFTVIRNNPATPGLISGPTNACPYLGPNGNLATYSVGNVLTVGTYNWTLPNGVTDVSGHGTNSISLRFTTEFTSGTISVSAVNGCGTSNTRSLAVSRLAPSTPSVIDVIQESECPSRVYSYSITGMPANAQSVAWSIPNGGIIISGQGTPRIRVLYVVNVAILGKISVVAINNCRNSSTRTLDVKIPACPPAFAKNNTGNHAVNKNPDTENPSLLGVQVFPNPATNTAKLMVNSPDHRTAANIRVLDVQGKMVSTFTVIPGEWHPVGQNLQPGMYFIEMIQNRQRVIQKFVRL